MIQADVFALPPWRARWAAFSYPRPALLAFGLLAAVLCQPILAAADSLKRTYDVPAGDAGQTLKQFAQQAKREIMFPAEPVTNVRTNAVKGEFTALEAINRMLSGTELAVVQDDKSGALAINRIADPNVGRAAPVETRGRPQKNVKNKDGITELEGVEVTGSRLRQTEVEGFSPVLSFDRDYIDRTGFGTLDEFMRTLPQNFNAASTGRLGVPNAESPTLFTRSAGQTGVGLRGLGSNSTLVLIDGRRAPLSGKPNPSTTPPQSFFDINTIPLGLIDRIEVLTDGASAIYGTDAVGGVVNIILKKDVKTTEVKTRIAGTYHGGGFEKGVTISSGFVAKKLSGMITLDVLDRAPILGNQRWFSRHGDYRDRGGTDQRGQIGYPLTIYALPGQTLRNLTNPNGTGATQAVVPSGQDGRGLTIAAFAPTVGQRTYYNNAALYSLSPPRESYGVSMRGTYKLNDRIELFADASYTETRVDTLGNPVGTSNQLGAAASPRIPASNPFNPFGQDLGINISHDEAGQRLAISHTNSWSGTIGARIDLPHHWSSETAFTYGGNKGFTGVTGIDNAAMTAALNQTDPNKALNLFGDFYAKGPTNAPGVYESILRTDYVRADSGLYTVETFARGSLYSLKAGDVQLVVGGSWELQDRLRTQTAPPTPTAAARSEDSRYSYAAFAEMSVPIFGPKQDIMLVRSFELQFAGRHEFIEDAGRTTNPKYAFRWQPWKWLLLRGSYGTGYRAPSLSEFDRPQIDTNPSITDRKRAGERYNVHLITGAFPNLKPETSKTYNYGVVINVPFVKGLSLGVDGYRKEQKNLTTNLPTQTLIDYEDLFPDRIIRTPAVPVDTAAGFPGKITDVDGRFANFGSAVTEGFDVNAAWHYSTSNWGRFTGGITATYFQSYKVAFNPGDQETDRSGAFGFPQKWKGLASILWDRGRWGGSLFCYYSGRARTTLEAPLGSFTTWDINGTYELTNRIRLQAGLGNIFDTPPPFANTTFGYDTGYHSPRMRSYSATVTYRY